MKIRNKIWHYPLIITMALSLSVLSCKKDKTNDDDNNTTPLPTTVTDADGNVYNTVTIGTQTWMKANLKTTKYNDGTSIAYVTTTWNGLTTGAYCNYNNDANNAGTYGRLYNGFAAFNSKVCPSGWHVPSDAEWETLATSLGGTSVAGGKLKEAGTSHWMTPNTDADNSSGFTALPGGERDYTNGSFSNLGNYGTWWTSTEAIDDLNALYRHMSYKYAMISGISGSKYYGYSIRCVKN